MPALPPARENHVLNAIRTLAAVVVLVEHVRSYLFLGRDDVSDPGAIHQALYAVTAFGHGAVVVFFVLSGYFVGGSVIAQERRGRFSWLNYSVSRLTRLWIVLIPAVLLTMICVAVGAALFPQSLVYGPGGGGVEDAQWYDAIGNVFFLQTILVPPLGTNGPLWSLTYEAVYYFLFPLIFIGVLRRRGVTRIVSVVLVIALALFVGADILLLFPLWLLGAGVAWHEKPIRAWLARRPYALLLSLRIVLFAGVFGATWLDSRQGASPENHPPATFLLAILMTALIATLLPDLHPRNRLASGLLRGASRYAHSSYSLYAMHAPLLLLLATALSPVGPHREREPTILNWLLLLAIAAVTMVVGWGFARLTEHNTDAVRRKVMSLLLTRRQLTTSTRGQ